MQRAMIYAGLLLLALVPFSRSAPVDGSFWQRKEIGAASAGQPGMTPFSRTYAAGQRACVIVIGDHDPVVDVEIKVYDSKEQIVAEDRGSEQAKDFVAVMWYPPRQETYRIEVYNYGQQYNKCSIAIK
jgi:hypothetical protein